MRPLTILAVTLCALSIPGCREDNPLDIDDDGDGYSEFEGDCNDTDPTLNPDTTWYADQDLDGFGNVHIKRTECEAPDSTTDILAWVRDPTEFDCDDEDDTIFPGATELCDGLDNDCDDVLSDPELDLDEDGWIE